MITGVKCLWGIKAESNCSMGWISLPAERYWFIALSSRIVFIFIYLFFVCVCVLVFYIPPLLCRFNTSYIPKYTNTAEFSIKEANACALKLPYYGSPFILQSTSLLMICSHSVEENSHKQHIRRCGLFRNSMLHDLVAVWGTVSIKLANNK